MMHNKGKANLVHKCALGSGGTVPCVLSLKIHVDTDEWLELHATTSPIPAGEAGSYH